MKAVTVSVPIQRSARVMQIEGMFDIAASQVSTTTVQLNLPDLSERPWNVGLIYGPSGSGKSTVARSLFSNEIRAASEMSWPADRAVIDSIESSLSLREVVELLSSVGFSSPPAWLRPYHALSNGEQFRVSLARLLAEQTDVAVMDEFTSVVDRTVARIGSHAVAKAVRRRGQKFVAVSCHADIIEWLQPDWTYQPASGEFRWELLQRRPPVELEVIRCTASAWQHFARHHYLDHALNKAAAVYVGLIERQPAVLAGILSFPHPKVKNVWKVSRIVVTPDYQGIGLAGAMLDLLGGGYRANGMTLDIVTSHPAMVAALNKRPTWSLTRKPTRTTLDRQQTRSGFGLSANRLTCSFRYCGDGKQEARELTRRVVA